MKTNAELRESVRVCAENALVLLDTPGVLTHTTLVKLETYMSIAHAAALRLKERAAGCPLVENES